MKVTSLGSIGVLIATAMLLTLLFAGCATTQLANATRTSQEPLPTSLPPEKKGSVRTVGVLFGGDPQFDMHSYKKDQQSEAARGAFFGGLGGFGAGILGAVLLGEAVLFPISVLDPGTVAAASISYFFPAIMLTTALGSGLGVVSTVVKSAPAKRAEEIEAAVLPALSGFRFQESIVEQILAAGIGNTEYSFANANDHPSEEVDTMLKVSVLNVGLRKAENSLELSAGVRAQLIEKDTGTVLAQRTFSHAWRTFGRNRPESGDEPLTSEEIDGYLHVLSEDIVDTLFLVEDFPTLYSAGVSGPRLGGYSEALQPRNPKPEYSFFGAKWKSAAVDSLQPRLEWVPFPSKRDREMDTIGRLNAIGQVSYDLRIWRLAEEMHHPSELVYERKGLADPWDTVEQPLEYAKTYYWAVRARFVRNGQPAMTQWTTCPGFLPLITKEGTIADSFSSQLSGLYRFSTPALPK